MKDSWLRSAYTKNIEMTRIQRLKIYFTAQKKFKHIRSFRFCHGMKDSWQRFAGTQKITVKENTEAENFFDNPNAKYKHITF